MHGVVAIVIVVGQMVVPNAEEMIRVVVGPAVVEVRPLLLLRHLARANVAGGGAAAMVATMIPRSIATKTRVLVKEIAVDNGVNDCCLVLFGSTTDATTNRRFGSD